MANPWTDAHVETLIELWRDCSASTIADALNKTPGPHHYTRCAVLGKAFRMGMPKKAFPTVCARKSKPQQQQSERAETPRGPATPSPRPITARQPIPQRAGPIMPPVEPLMLPLLALEPHHCRYPIGEPRTPGFGFCGQQRAGDGPYCDFHHSITHQRTIFRAA